MHTQSWSTRAPVYTFFTSWTPFQQHERNYLGMMFSLHAKVGICRAVSSRYKFDFRIILKVGEWKLFIIVAERVCRISLKMSTFF